MTSLKLVQFNTTVSLKPFGPEKGNFSCLSDWNSVVPRHPLETTWDVILILAIFIINCFIIFVVRKSHLLWKPRHYLMASLCVANVLLGVHQLFGLGLDLWPGGKLCIIYRMTIGIPVQVNSVLLALISMDRFIAVRFPFFHGSSVNNFRVLLFSVAVVAIGVFLSGALSFLGIMYPLIPLSNWLMFLPFTLTGSCAIILYCNATVLVAARQKMKSSSARSVIAGCYYSECESSELLGTLMNASTDDLHGQNSPHNEALCSFVRRELPDGNLISNYETMTYNNEDNNGSQHLLTQSEPKILCQQIKRVSRPTKFARAAFIMTVPTLIFFVPMIVIVPLKYAEDSGCCDLGEKVNVLWNYLLIHFRSIFPLQCVLDPIIYLTYSKESRRSSRAVLRRWWGAVLLQRGHGEDFPMAYRIEHQSLHNIFP